MQNNRIICGFCNKTFGTQGIHRHVRSKHGDVPDSDKHVEKWRVAQGYKANPYKSLSQQWADAVATDAESRRDEIIAERKAYLEKKAEQEKAEDSKE